MKTKEELSALKKEVETLRGKLSELTEDELAVVTGGAEVGTCTSWVPRIPGLFCRVPSICNTCSHLKFDEKSVEPYCEEGHTVSLVG